MPRKNTAIARTEGAKSEQVKIPVIGYAILGRLARHDQTGYELSLLMGPPKNFNWDAGHSQIYPALAALTEAGYVEFSHVTQEGRPNKKVYRITDAGGEALRAWVKDAPTPTPMRDEFSLKVFSLWLVAPEDAIEALTTQIEFAEKEIAQIDDLLKEVQKTYNVTFPVTAESNVFGVYSSVMFSRETRSFALQWYRWMLGQFKNVIEAKD